MIRHEMADDPDVQAAVRRVAGSPDAVDARRAIADLELDRVEEGLNAQRDMLDRGFTTWDEHVEAGRRDLAEGRDLSIPIPAEPESDPVTWLEQSVAECGHASLYDAKTGEIIGRITGPPVRTDNETIFEVYSIPLRWEGDDS